MNAALVLLDLQHDYLDGGRLRPSAGAVVAKAGELLSHWRSSARPLAHIVTTVDRADDRRMAHWKSSGVWKCERGTRGHELPTAVQPRAGEAVFHKTHYSGFEDPHLEPWLRAARIDTLIIPGVHLHACVRSTALDAAARGFSVIIADDATGTDDPTNGAITRRYLSLRGFRFVPAHALIHGSVDAPPPPREAIEQAARSAANAGEEWSQRAPLERASILERAANAIDAQTETLIERLVSDIAKPVHYAAGEVRRAATLLRLAARAAESAAAVRTPSRIEVHRRPLGVVALVTPFNNPVAIPLGKIGPALAFGNTVVWKPAPEGLAVAHMIADSLRRAGLPEGALGLVEGGRDAALSLAECASVDAVSLSGSESAGFALQEVCARRAIPLQAELGGNNAAIVCPDADLDLAAKLIAEGAFGFAGQRCTATRRVIVDTDCLDRFEQKLLAATANLGWGSPEDPATRIGPLISNAKKQQLDSLIERARADGLSMHAPHLEAGALHPKGPAPYFAPLIVRCDDDRHEIVQEESFGPILVLQPATGFDRALSLCNAVRQGLAAALFSSSAETRSRFLAGARAGVLKINLATADAAADAPFGGWKSSGLGPPEHADANREFYTRAQSVYG